MAYREGTTERRIETVRHRPMGLAGTIGLALMLLAFSGFTFFQGMTFVRSTRLECVRGGANECVILRSYGPFTTREAVPIHYLRAVSITSHRNKSTTSYGVALNLVSGGSIALMRPASRAQAELVKSGVELIAFDPRPGSSAMPVQDGSIGSGIFMTVMAVGMAVLMLVFTRSAELVFDLDRRTIQYTRGRWPLRPARQTWPADEVTRARVSARPGSKGRTIYETVLVMRDNTDFALVSGGGGSEAHNEASATQINAVLSRMRD